MIETTTYMPPLRFAIRWCIETARGASVDPRTVATIAQVRDDRAVAYCSILVAQQALEPIEGGRVKAGPGWQRWADSPCKSRPVSGASASSAEMDSLRRAMGQNLRRLREAAGWSQAELARRAGIYHTYVQRAEKYCDPPPAMHLIMLAKALGVSVEQLCEQGAYLGR